MIEGALVDNEYLYKLGVDASDLDQAISTTVSIIGELDNLLGSKMPRSTAAFVGGLEKARAEMNGVAADSSKVVAGVGQQASAFDAYLNKLREAKVAYQTLRQEMVTGQSTGQPTFNVATASTDQLKELVATARASQDTLVADANREVTARVAAEQQVTREVEAAVATRAAAYSRELEAALKVDEEIRNARLFQNTNGTTLGTTSDRNTAAGRTVMGANSLAAPATMGMTENEGVASGQTLAAMNTYYTAQGRLAEQTQKTSEAQATQGTNLPRLRYALYDVSMALGLAGAAFAGVGVAVEKTTIEYQALFAQVERSSHLDSPQALKQLKADLIGVTEELPATFADVTKIATLGNQLNIPAAALVGFTKTVTEFAAESNVSTETAATAFGRLGQIFKTTDYKQLGDEIAYLGVNAVATEGDIIKVAQQIAVTTTSYGLSEKQTLALATAYASLGIRAESARGTTQRAFSDIQAAVKAGGTKLEEIARVSGLSATDFKKQWQDDASGAFTTFVTGLGKSGSNAKSILAELGITAQRDITSLMLLGQNVNVLTKAQDDAGKSAGYMDKAYQAIANTVQSQLVIAGNKIKAIFNEIGASADTPVAGLIHLLNDLLTVIDAIAKDPIAAGGMGITVGILSLTGAVLIGIAALARFKANMLAVSTAVDQLGLSDAKLSTVFRTMVLNQGTQTKASQEQTAALNELAAAEQNAATKGEQLNAVQIRNAAEQGRVTAGTAANAVAQDVGNVGVQAQMGAQGLGTLEKAGVGASTALGARGLLGLLTGPEGLLITLGLLALPLLPAAADAAQAYIDKMTGAAISTDQLSASIRGLAASGSKETLGQISSALSYANGTALGGAGRGGKGSTPFSGVQAYYNQQNTGSYYGNKQGVFDPFSQVGNQGKEAGNQIQTLDSSLAGFAAAKDYKSLAAGLKVYHDELKGAGLSQKQLDSLLTQTSGALNATKGQTLAAAIADAKKGDAASTASKKQQGFTDSLTSYMAAAFGASQKTSVVQTALSALGKEYVDAGAKSAGGSSQMQAAIKAIVDQAGSAPRAAAELETLYQVLVKMGMASPGQLVQLKQVIADYGGSGKVAAAAVPGISALADGYNKAADAAAKSATATNNQAAAVQKSRTLMDYGNDLNSTISSMLQYQFGLSDSTDKIVSGWQKMKDDAAAAAASVKTIRADLLALSATKQEAKFDLGIAKMYGDQIGAAKAQAVLAKANDDTAAKNKELAKAQDASSMSLKGSSAAAIANRATLESQIQGYQGYIVALAESGASQAQVEAATRTSKAEFIRQATQLGFNRAEVNKLADAFTGMGQIINAIPRNITTNVNAKTSAAMKAIADYKAAIKDAQATAGKQVTIPAPIQTPPTPKDKTSAEAIALMGEINALSAALASPNKPRNSFLLSDWAHQLSNYRTELANLTGFEDGGWTGGGNPWDVAGVVHGREFVLNSTGARVLPMSDLMAMNQGRAPQSTGTTVVVQPGASGQGFSAQDRMFLAQVLSAKPAIQFSANQFGRAIDGANVTAGMRGAG